MNRGSDCLIFRKEALKHGFIRAFPLVVFIIFSLAPLPASAETSILPFPDGNAGIQVWTKAGSPYVVTGDVYMRFGSITIEPGVVVKFAPDSTLEVHADVVANIQGTAAEPVYFTSLKDDSVGGDTNGDGNMTAPQPGDWGFLSFGGGSWNNSMNISYTKVRYGGSRAYSCGPEVFPIGAGPALIMTFQKFSGSPGRQYDVSHIESSRGSGVGLCLYAGNGNSVTVSDSSFFNNALYGLYRAKVFVSGFPIAGTVNVQNNWWGDPTGPYQPTSNSTGLGNALGPVPSQFEVFSFSPWLFENPMPDAPPPLTYAECCSSVVFLPGIKGSVLKIGSGTIWPPTILSSDIPRLAIDPLTGESTQSVLVDGVLENFYGTPIYSGFTTYLDSLVSDGTIGEWEPLPYDWRFSPEKILTDGVNTPAGDVDLIEQIEQVAANSETGQVTIVAHSMGGLMGKAIIKKLEDAGKADLIDSFVMVGTPQLGTPQAIAALLHGDDESILGGLIVNPALVRQVGQNTPGSYNLLPSQKYFEEVSDPVVVFDENAGFTEEWRNYWGVCIPEVYCLNNFLNYFAFLTGGNVARLKPLPNELRTPEILNPSLLSDAADLHKSIDTYTFPSAIRVVQIAGWGLPTTKAVLYKDHHFLPSYKIIPTLEGDRTVVYSSAVGSIADETYFFNLAVFNALEEVEDSQHRDLLGANPIQTVISEIVQESGVNENTYIKKQKPIPASVEDQVIISSHSPVVLGVYDSFGNFTGISQNQDLSSEILSISEAIPGSAFVGSAESQYIFLPKQGAYRFVYKGTGVGPTTIEVENLSNEMVTPISVYSDMPTTPSTEAHFAVDAFSSENVVIELDTNSDGQTDTYIAAEGQSLTLAELLVNLKTAVQSLNVSEKLKRDLLKRVEKIEKKISKQKNNKATKAVMGLEKKITKKTEKGTISATDAQVVLNLLEQIENAI